MASFCKTLKFARSKEHISFLAFRTMEMEAKAEARTQKQTTPQGESFTSSRFLGVCLCWSGKIKWWPSRLSDHLICFWNMGSVSLTGYNCMNRVCLSKWWH